MKPRILFIVPLPPPVHGSAMMCRYIRESRLINEAFRCDYVNLSTSRRMDEIGRRSVRKLLRFAGSYLKALGLLLTRRYDACYLAITCHGTGFLKDAPFVWLCKWLGRRVIIHQHNKGMAACAGRLPYRWLLPLTYRHTTVILLSWRLYADVEQVVERSQVRICPNGIPDQAATPEPAAAQRGDLPRLLFLSNLLVSKGVIDLLDACRLLKEAGYRFTCRFVGSETSEMDAARFAREVHLRGLDETVDYAGPQYGAEKDKAIAQCDALVLPTLNDCFPLVLLEAMRSARPVVTTDVGATADLTEDGRTGLIARKHDPKDLAEKIRTLLDHPDLAARMGQEGRERFMAHYSLGRYEAAVQSLLTDICNRGGVRFATYLGRQYGEAKNVIFNGSDIFVFPTYYPNECFPLVLLEAMQHALPVVATPEGAICDLVNEGHTGLIAQPRNPHDLARKIRTLLDHPDLARRMGQEGRKTYETLFTAGRFEQTLKRLIDEVLQRP